LIFGFIGPLLAVIFGCITLSQIRKSGQGGRGRAITGLVLSGVWALAIATGVAVAVATSAHRDGGGQVAAGGSVSTREMRPGDCLNDLHDSTDLVSLPAVPCAQPHEGEVFAVFDLPAGPYPGPTAVDEQSNSGCTARFGDLHLRRSRRPAARRGLPAREQLGARRPGGRPHRDTRRGRAHHGLPAPLRRP
jgi:hypothetical protein